MGDDYRVAVSPGDRNGALKLVVHRIAVGNVIQKYISLNRRHAPFTRDGQSNRFARGTAVEKKQAASVELLHQQIHRLGMLGEQTTGVVAYAYGIGDRSDCFCEQSAESLWPHVQCQCAINVVYMVGGYWFHGLMKNDFFAGEHRAPCRLGGVRRERQHAES